MRPQEFFWFRTKKYKSRVTTRHTNELSTEATREQEKMDNRRERLTLLILVIVITHGVLLPLALVYFRSLSVGKRKVSVITDELRQRRMKEFANEIQELERVNGKPFSPAEIDAVLLMLDAGETEQNDLHEHIASYEEISRDAPPPYEIDETKYR